MPAQNHRIRPRTQNALDILLDQVGVSAAVHEDLFDAGVREKFEGVFDQRGVREREETLARRRVSTLEDMVKTGRQTYPWAFESEGGEARLERIREYLRQS